MADPATKIKVWTLEWSNGEQGYTIEANEEDTIACIMEGLDVGEQAIITIGEMTKEEYDAMPEYAG